MHRLVDKKDIQILRIIQRNSKLTTREIAKQLKIPVTTVFTRIKRLEQKGIIKGYRAILDEKKLGKSTTAFILASFTYRTPNRELLSQRELAKEIAKFPEVQEVHIITGDWDLLIKIKAESVEAIGKFVIDKLRLVKGIEKTLTCVVFETEKETTEISL
ncbi:Lrp/AsnC family transcriptional regulator [Candidatus Bathyarchaeota archaeon]|nr:MAG: Lrp/AsnC family transcriptional regulator [Candidatus Bathyarchaeota archaeon]